MILVTRVQDPTLVRALFATRPALPLLLVFSLLSPVLAGQAAAQQVVTLASGTTWALDEPGSGINAVQVCLVAAGCPAGATTWNFSALGGSWVADLSPIPGATWIWAPGLTASSPATLATYTFSQQVVLNGPALSGTFWMTADDLATVAVNGRQAGSIGSISTGGAWPLTAFDIRPFLVVGVNTITVTGTNGPASFAGGRTTYRDNPAGVVFGGRITADEASAVPGQPGDFAVLVSGNDLAMTWSGAATGGLPTGYTLIARQAAGGPPIATLTLGIEQFLQITAPSGSFVLTIQASNGLGAGPESAPVSVTLPGALVLPGAPVALSATVVANNTASFRWRRSADGGNPTSYVLVAGQTPGFTSPIATLPLPNQTTLAVPNVPAGTYYVRVIARNAAGSSGPSNEVLLSVPLLVVPAQPLWNPEALVGSVLTLSWAAGPGPTPAHYRLQAALSPGGAAIVDTLVPATAISFPRPPAGSYYLTLAAVNDAGSSAPATFTLVVP